MAGKPTLLTKRTEKNDPFTYTDSLALHYKGTYVPGSTYGLNDVVIYNNTLYRCTSPVSGSTPTSVVATSSTGGLVNVAQPLSLPTGSAAGDYLYILYSATCASASGPNSTSGTWLTPPTGASTITSGGGQSANASERNVFGLWVKTLAAADITTGSVSIPIQSNSNMSGAYGIAQAITLRGVGGNETPTLGTRTLGTADPMAASTVAVSNSGSSISLFCCAGTASGQVTSVTYSPTVTSNAFRSINGVAPTASFAWQTGAASIASETVTWAQASSSASWTMQAFTLPVLASSAFSGTTNWVEIAAIHDSNGRLQAVDPSASTDVATKNYVDSAATVAPLNVFTTSFTAVAGVNYANIATAATATLPSAPTNGTEVSISRIDTANTVNLTIAPGTGDTLNFTPATFPAGSVRLQYRAAVTSWYLLDRSFPSGATVPATTTSASTANALMLRDGNSRAQVADPSAAQDIATKNYIDVTAGVSASTASALMRRDVNGRASVADPSALTDIATKNYVDLYRVRGGLLVPVGYCAPPSNYTGNQSNGAPPSGSQTFVPVDILSGGTYNTIKTSVTTAAVGGTITCTYAVYKDDGTGTLPNLSTGLVTNQGPSTVTSVGMKTPSIGTTVLTAGRYWMSCFYYASVAPTTAPAWDTMGGSAPVGFLDPTSQASWEVSGPRGLRLTGLTAVATTTQAASAYTLVTDVTIPLMGLYRSA